MGGGSGGGGGDTTTTIRYAPYVEAAHRSFLTNLVRLDAEAVNNNPYDDYTEIPVDVGFFSSGYTLANYPSLYDMYGKFIAGLNIEALWTELFESTVNGPEADNLIRTEGAILTDNLDTNILPRFMVGMRDINAVNSSTFIIGKALLEDTQQKEIAKFSAALKYKLIGVAQNRYNIHLKWNSGVIDSYLNVMKHYFTIRQSYTTLSYEMYDSQMRWPLEMLDYERAGLGALQGAMKTNTSGKGGASQGDKILGGALSGAVAGFEVDGPVGAVVGGILGGLAGLL